jgi:iron complex transport system permease protein
MSLALGARGEGVIETLRMRAEMRRKVALIGLSLLLGGLSLAAIAIGPVPIGLGTAWAMGLEALGLAEASVPPHEAAILTGLRLPRLALGLACGAALGLAGAALQALFRNPLADPALIGVSGGAAFAAACLIILGPAFGIALTGLSAAFALPLVAFVGSLAATAFIYALAHQGREVSVATMLLAGIAINALANAGIGYLVFISDDQQLRAFTFWTFGSLASATWSTAIPALALMVGASLGILSMGRTLNGLLLGEVEATHLGIDVTRLKRRIVLLVAIAVGAAVALAGIIAFVGLMVPHLVRLAFGPDHRLVLPGSALLGPSLLLGADLFARMAVVPAELPIGVVTSAIGAPFFLWLLLRERRRVVLI